MISFSTFQYAAFFPRLAVFSIGYNTFLTSSTSLGKSSYTPTPNQVFPNNKQPARAKRSRTAYTNTWFKTKTRLPEPNGPGLYTKLLAPKQNTGSGAQLTVADRKRITCVWTKYIFPQKNWLPEPNETQTNPRQKGPSEKKHSLETRGT